MLIFYFQPYNFRPDQLKDSYIVTVTFKDNSTKTIDLKPIARECSRYEKNIGLEVGGELFRYMLREVYGNQLGDYAVRKNARRGHRYIGRDVLNKMFGKFFLSEVV